MRTDFRLLFWVRLGSGKWLLWLLLLSGAFLSGSGLCGSGLDDFFKALVEIGISTVHGVSPLGRLLEEMGRRMGTRYT